jgi:hypothetical protein
VCSDRAATRVENIRTEQKTAPLRYLGFALYKQNLEEVRKHKKTLRCLHTAEVAGSNPASPTRERSHFAGKTYRRKVGSGHAPRPLAAVRQQRRFTEAIRGIGYYHPDFVVVQSIPGENGESTETNWIIETKGRVWEDTSAKDKAIRHWCELVSNASGRPWRYERVDQSVFEGRDSLSFGELVDRAAPGDRDEPILPLAPSDGRTGGRKEPPSARNRRGSPT